MAAALSGILDAVVIGTASAGPTSAMSGNNYLSITWCLSAARSVRHGGRSALRVRLIWPKMRSMLCFKGDFR
ncbi:hypothetical protein BMJ32_30075 [Sinorhizobium medicae]|nr:hypothetical protein BMJ32_30075 [Sinorhizobium medicae]PLU55088.1 hypothetical protein BMJ23_18405 [Sinorhizobium medicae]PLU65588.1 hypothetical protein BMJ21_20815 [Sinorhizobium medicae]